MMIKKPKHYAPKKWFLSAILGKIKHIGNAIKDKNLTPKQQIILRTKRELEAMKKHICFLYELLDNYENIDE